MVQRARCRDLCAESQTRYRFMRHPLMHIKHQVSLTPYSALLKIGRFLLLMSFEK
jgi:hypothetical protein